MSEVSALELPQVVMPILVANLGAEIGIRNRKRESAGHKQPDLIVFGILAFQEFFNTGFKGDIAIIRLKQVGEPGPSHEKTFD